MKLTSARLYGAMKPGQIYFASELASQFDTATAEVRDMLCTLIEEGMVLLNSHGGRVLGFQRPVTDIRPDVLQEPDKGAAPPPLRTSVATPPVPRTFTGSLQHYETSLMQVQRLAMLTRRHSG